MAAYMLVLLTFASARTEILKLMKPGSAHSLDKIPQGKFPALCKNLGGSMWSCVKGHRSIKFEVGALACVRFWLKGSRKVVLLREEAILSFLRKIQKDSKQAGEALGSSHAISWATHVTAREFQEFISWTEDDLQDVAAWVAEFEPPAALYLPAGIICAESNIGSLDNVGLKACCIVPDDDLGTKLLRSLAGEAKDQGKQTVVLDDVLQYTIEYEAAEGI